MKLGIIGFPACGKTSLYNAVTGSVLPVGQYTGTPGAALAVMKVPDPRMEKLRTMYKPKSFVLAACDCVDFTGLISGTGGAGKEVKGEILGKLREVDAIVHVVRAFESSGVPHVLESVDPLRDLAETDSELLFADLAQCTARVEKLRVQAAKPTKTQEQDKKELATLEKVLKLLEVGQHVRGFTPANEDEKKKLAEGFVKYRGKWLSKPAYEAELAKEFEKSRARTAELAAHAEWRNAWTKETAHFVFKSNTSPEVLDYY